MTAQLPSFAELPLLPGLSLRYAWDVFGRDDDRGTLNLLDNQTVLIGLASARTGERIALTMPLSMPDPPLFGRQPVRQTLVQLDRNTWDDRLDSFFPQASSQWDGLRHVRCREHGFWTGVTCDPAEMGDRLGIEHWSTGIIGRGVLLDVRRHLTSVGNDYHPLSEVAITADDLRDTARAQDVDIIPGDILCVRVGWQESYSALTAGERFGLAAGDPVSHAGLSGAEDMAELLWDWHVAAVTCDNPSVEVSPGSPAVGSLHRRILPLLGIAMGELFDFEMLAARCEQMSRWSFAFVGVPMNLVGGLGSPANAVAVL